MMLYSGKIMSLRASAVFLVLDGAFWRANGIRKISGYSIESMEFVESGDFRFVMSYDVRYCN